MSKAGKQPAPVSGSERKWIALHEVLQILREATDESVLFEAVMHYLQEGFGCALVWIGLYQEHMLVGRACYASSGERLSALTQKFPLRAGDLFEPVVVQKQYLEVPDLQVAHRAGPWKLIAQKLDVKGAVISPIVQGDRCYGVVVLGFSYWGVTPRLEGRAELAVILGSLGAALERLTAQQQTYLPTPSNILFSLFTQLSSLPKLAQRLDAITEQTHRFIQPSCTNLYWYEPEQRYFWRRTGVPRMPGGGTDTHRIAVQDIKSFYQSLSTDRLIAIGDASSVTQGDIVGVLRQRLQAQSLLAAPILNAQGILGFVMVEGKAPRVWTEGEKEFLRGIAQLVALLCPLEAMEEQVAQALQNQTLATGIIRAIYSDQDWYATVSHCAQQLCQSLNITHFLALRYDPKRRNFEVCAQYLPPRCPELGAILPTLSDVDWRMLETMTEVITIEDFETDLRLLSWKSTCLALGMRSLLVCRTSLSTLDSLVIVGHNTERSWLKSEHELLQLVSRQVGLVLHQWHLQQQVTHLEKLHQDIQVGLTATHHIEQLEFLDRRSLQHIAQTLSVPFVTLVSWLPGLRDGRVVAPIATSRDFEIKANMSVPVRTDPLIQQAIQESGIFPLLGDALAAETRQWLTCSGLGKMLVVALRTAADYEPTGVVIVGHYQNQEWGDRTVEILDILTRQLAASRRHLILTLSLQNRCRSLEALNWYKNHRLDSLRCTLNGSLKQLAELRLQGGGLGNESHQQVLQQLVSALVTLTKTLQDETWRLSIQVGTLPLASLLRHALARIDSLAQQRHIWIQTHTEGPFTLQCDVAKVETVIHELLLLGCAHCPTNGEGRIDIWCRPLSPHEMEISLTHNGELESRLLEELIKGRSPDLFAPSSLDQPPGLHLAICQSLVRSLGSELTFGRLDDGRVLCRMVLPYLPSSPLS